MIDTNKLRGKIAENGFSQREIAEIIGVTPKTFYDKMKRGIFDSDEMYKMVELLNIEEPAEIFFAKEVTY